MKQWANDGHERTLGSADGRPRRRATRVAIAAVVAFLTLCSLASASGTQVAHDQYGYPYPNASQCTGGGACVADQWAFYQGQCTSWVAYRVSQLNGIAFNNFYGGGGRWGDASSWGAHAGALHIPVNGTPAVGAVAWYASGHVAYVEQVNSPTSVVVSEMNIDYHNGFRVTTITPGNHWPSGFIHIHDRTGPAPIGEGSFVNVAETGRVYRIAGGAPIYVSSWSAFGGPQPSTTVSAAQLAGMRGVPADGTFVSSTSTGRVYRIAGGAPTYVSAWSGVGGAPASVIGIDQWAIDRAGADPNAHLNSVPADGTLISSTATGRVYKIAGGAPLYVSSWDAIGGAPPGVVNIDQWAIDQAGSDPNAHLNRVPADGSFIASHATGRVFKIAGGAPIYVSAWDAIGGQPSAVTTVDQWAIDQAGSDPNAHLNRVPADGSFISSTATGRVYRIVSGAPLYVSAWDAIGGAAASVNIDQWAIDQAGTDPNAHLNPRPADGAFIRSFGTGRVYRIAGGAPLYVSSFDLFGGLQPFVDVDQWDIDQAGQDSNAHLSLLPADGTQLKGLPSGRGWLINGGHKTPVSASAAAVGVDDLSIAQIPDQPRAPDAQNPRPLLPAMHTPGGRRPGAAAACKKARATVARDRRRISKLQRSMRSARSAKARLSMRRSMKIAKQQLKRHQKKSRRVC